MHRLHSRIAVVLGLGLLLTSTGLYATNFPTTPQVTQQSGPNLPKDLTAPGLQSSNPSDGATNHPIGNGIILTFTSLMDYPSLVSGLKLHRKAPQGADLQISIYPATPTGNNKEFRVFPAGGDKFEDEASYTLTVSDQVKSISGQKMSAPASISFTTISKRFKSVSAGFQHTCALKDSGQVLCWGDNEKGQLGDGTNQSRKKPKLIPNLSNIKAIAAGYTHTCAIDEGDHVLCWGDNSRGQLGDGTQQDKLVPTQVSGLSGVKAIDTGDEHTCAVLQNAEVRCWGDNTYGQGGDAGPVEDGQWRLLLTPTHVVNLSNVVSVELGGKRSCALLQDETVKCWGENVDGEIGDGTKNNDTSTPKKARNLDDAIDVSAGELHTCAVTQGGGVKCWGWTQSPSPETVEINTVAEVSVGDAYAVARTTSGQVLSWGENTSGQLGDGTTEDHIHTITTVSGLNNALSVSTSGHHACAVLQDHSIQCWGQNTYGEIGDGSQTMRKTPTPISYY